MNTTKSTRDIKFRNVCFTTFEPEFANINNIASLLASEVASEVAGNTKPQLKNLNYICWGTEICPNTGKTHYQGYMEFNQQVRLSTLKNVLPTTHFEERKGSQSDAIDYCKKDGKFVEYGTKSKQGKRTDLETVAKKLATRETTIGDIAIEQPEMIVKYYKGLKQLEQCTQKVCIKEKDIYVFWGAAGSGKSHKVYNDNPLETIYKVKYGNSGVWFDGYDNMKHKVVVFDEFCGQIKLQNLLEYLDKYPVQVEYKGGLTYFTPDKVYICSNKHPKD